MTLFYIGLCIGFSFGFAVASLLVGTDEEDKKEKEE